MKNRLLKVTFTIFLVIIMMYITSCNNNNNSNNNDDSSQPIVQYTLSFETYGGTQVESLAVNAGTTVELTSYVTEKANYTFEGWYSDQYFNNRVTEVTVNKDVTIYAGYEENKYQIKFETDGGTTIEPIEAYRGTIVKGPEDPTKEGYIFGGWYKDSEFIFSYEFLDNSFMHGYDLTLYAKWIEAKNITVDYLGIEKEDLVLSGIESAEVEVVETEIEGYVFEGFYQDEECTKEYTFSIYPTEDETVYAKYHKLNENVKITYVSLDKTVKVEENLVELNEVEVFTPEYEFDDSRDYYYFDAWYIDSAYSMRFENIVPEEDITLYARWVRDGKYVCISFEGLDEKYFVKKGTLISKEIFDDYLSNVNIPEGLIMDGYVTSEGSTFDNEDYAYRDMTLSTNIYSDGLEFEPVYVETLDGEGNVISVVGSYSVKGFNSFGKMVDTLVLPDYYQGYKVTEISENAFKSNKNFKNIELPANLEKVCANAFEGSKSLESIAFPKSLKTIDDSAFKDCTKLSEVSYEGRLTSVGYKVFENTKYLSDLRDLGEGGIYIGRDNEVIYEYNRNLVSRLNDGAKAVFGDKGATIVAGGAFEGIEKLSYVSLPKTITTIGKEAFKGCIGLKEIAINSDLVTIEEKAFYGCSSLVEFVFPESLMHVGDEAFRYAGLEKVTLNYAISDYGTYVFANCENLVSILVYIESALTSVKEGMFYGCTSLEGFICTDLIETIEPYAFANCTSLESVYIGYTTATVFNKIEANAFKGCYDLKRVYFLKLADGSGKLLEIDENAFEHFKPNGEPTKFKFYVPNVDYDGLDFEGTYQEYYISKLHEVYASRILPYDTTKPTLKQYITTYQMDPSAEVDVYELIKNGGIYSATDNVTATEDLVLRINYVKFNSSVVLDPVEGTDYVYDMTNGGSYVISYSIIDDFGNATAGSLTIIVYEKEL